MKFIEVTTKGSLDSILINLEKIHTIRPVSKRYNRTKKTGETLIDFGDDEYMYVIEDYDTIKKQIEGLQLWKY